SFWEIYLSNEKIVKDFYDENINDFEISLSGSGSCMYVTYNERKEIDKLVKKIPSNWRFFFCKPLQYSPIRLL
ncbi:MAG: 4-(cytidine 5'-diphospho)-2-C-methyl-D-erythritol kinase, partial [Gammaproteobacteria bacterium]